MDYLIIVKSATVLLVLGVVLSAVIVLLSKKLSIKDNPKIAEVREYLSGANCGACGFPGCDAFAKAIVENGADINACTPTTEEKRKLIAAIMSKELNAAEQTRVVVRCAGGNACKDKYDYHGYGDCKSAEILAGGRKSCYTGCLGQGTCVDACPHNAIKISKNGYPEIDGKKCSSCGVCTSNCPKLIVRRVRASAKVYCACRNKNKGRDVSEYCKKGCIGCTLCSKICPEGAITMQENLPQFDYDKCNGCYKCVEKCPTKSILKR